MQIEPIKMYQVAQDHTVAKWRAEPVCVALQGWAQMLLQAMMLTG